MFETQSVSEVLANLRTKQSGLLESDVKKRQLEYGYNELLSKKTSLFLIFVRQFQDVLVYILFGALLLSIVAPFLEGHATEVKSFVDAIIILTIILLNAAFGFFQEWKAESAIAMLQSLTAPQVRVRRAGHEQIIAARELTIGDIVIIEAGDKISADGRLIEVSHVDINESSLTGESLPQSKTTKPIAEAAALADKDNMVFAGTLVTGGSAVYVVTAIGLQTEIGKISALVSSTTSPETPLQIRLRSLGYRLGIFVLLAVIAISLIGLYKHTPLLQIMLIAVSLAVSAVPEGLPAVVTICFALGVKRMVQKHALIRRLDALETLGSVTVICSDKTGTITENKMTVVDSWLFGKSTLEQLCTIAASCNRAQLPNLGDPTETGLLEYAELLKIKRLPIDTELVPFNSIDKYMKTKHGTKEYIKGALESVLALCKVKNATEILEQNEQFASRGLRVLAFAEAAAGKPLEFIGLLALEDPPRRGVMQSIALAKSAGIRSMMITGDNAITAQAIAHRVGIMGAVIDGKQLDATSKSELREIVKSVSIYARVSPQNKLQILHALQANGEIVAMSGDGVNDAPALKGAHVGIAMGKVGTQVAREASSMVLADDNFSTIVNAIAEGRRIYDNIKKFVLFLLRTNFSALLFITSTVTLGLPLPYLPIHILWINLVTDGLPALALSVEKAEPNVMKRPPRPANEGILAYQLPSLVIFALFGFCVSFVLYMYLLQKQLPIEYIRTVLLTSAILFELMFVHSIRSTMPLHTIGFFSNRWLLIAISIPIVLHLLLLYTPLVTAFSLAPINAVDWLYILPIALSGLFVGELFKLVDTSFKKKSV